MPKVRLLVQLILEQIRSLYDLSSLLRRPKITDKFTLPVDSKLNTATLGDSDALPPSVGFSNLDESHIMEKVLQWRVLTRSGRNIEYENDIFAPMGQGEASEWVEDIMWFCQRLARANTTRREQLQYWANNPCDPIHDTTNEARLTKTDLTQILTEQGKQQSRSQASTTKPPDPNLPREGSRSAESKQSFSTTHVSNLCDTSPNVGPRTVYASTHINQGRSKSVPDLPKTANENVTFPCPYCGMTLDSSEMQNRQSWK
jgi:hypothetical protein